MRVRRLRAEQAHWVPSQAYYAPGVFRPEVTAPGEILYSDDEGPDDGGNYTPRGSTAQNGFKEVKWYRCTFCQEVLRETHTDGHDCGADQ